MIIASRVSQQYKDRYEAFCDIASFINSYKLNIGFKKEKIKTLTKEYKDKTTILGCYKEYLDNGTFDLCKVKLLNNEEKSHLKDIFLKFGNGDYETEKKLSEIAESYTKEKIEETKQIKDKWCPMIMKLTFLFSLGVAILFI